MRNSLFQQHEISVILQIMTTPTLRKIIHIDMDCFYAAVEIREQPHLRNQPVAIGGDPHRRGVLSTCNYIARQFGLRSAMPTHMALRLCPNLVLLPANMSLYREISHSIRDIFYQYTDLVEPLSLDEAYLDITDCQQYHNSATWIAQAIQRQIQQAESLTASAGVAPNKFLAKVASDWNKPNGLCVIPPEEVDCFSARLPIKNIAGVGKVTAAKLAALNIRFCADLRRLDKLELTKHFGSFGETLYDRCRGIDDRAVKSERIRKSVSVEHTFEQNLLTVDDCLAEIPELYQRLNQRLHRPGSSYPVHKQFVKIKFVDFSHTTVECVVDGLSVSPFYQLMQTGFARQAKAVRLLGVGVRFAENEQLAADSSQQQLPLSR